MFHQCVRLKSLRPIYCLMNSFYQIPSSHRILVNVVSRRNTFTLTGIQPSGKPHLGNYLGVIKPCITYYCNNDVSQFFMLIADLHALTSQNCVTLEYGIHELVATLLACGFEAKSSRQIIFLQSSVPGHTELAWILSSVCSVRRLAHLPQWREKSGYYNSMSDTSINDNQQMTNISDHHSVGLFTYPTLQAADILLYGAHSVPIGTDQITHIELARDLVRSAIHKWPSLSSILHVPNSLIFETPKITNLRNPTKKMSKSDTSEMGIIYLTDTPDSIHKKIKRAETDSIRKISYNVDERPGVSNLLRILAAIEGRKIEEILSTVSDEWNKEELKSKVTDAIIHELDPIQKRLNYLMLTEDGQSTIVECLSYGSVKANELARKRLKLIYSAIGCSIPIYKHNTYSSNCNNSIVV
ncbi:Tryptophan--tRNA ligase isoform 4 [Schistosoma japonicum]|uniref:tryptophan--tRNA ligase n=1 Tax=Schistosoma japonicum TaxID=6182 RepID=A0A4Z2D6Y8_SCHJA|nr:Tryptophan--tRNA ligase isoform 4 [Schistosoma japonicum]TNN12252.1 Tryptophan--tRNA ligase isoform 4 [Schistosoma japonicum]